MQKKFNIRLNSIDKVEELLQETYNLTTNQINQTQEEITAIKNSTVLVDADIDVKEKYGKIMNSYLTTIQKAIDRKYEIAKFMGEVIKYNGDLKKAVNNGDFSENTSLNLEAIRKTVNDISANTNTPEKYELKRKK